MDLTLGEIIKLLFQYGPSAIVALVIFYFYRELAQDFKSIVQENTAAIVELKNVIRENGKTP